MTKKITVIIAILLGIQLSATSQEIYNEVLAKSEAIVNDPKASDINIKLNHFKSTALRYIRSTAHKQKKQVTASFLDVQAYYMSDFLGRFFKDLSTIQNSSEKKRKEYIMMYVNASVGNPLFENQDEEITECFIDDNNNLTPFSLNTDWEKACKAIDIQKKK